MFGGRGAPLLCVAQVRVTRCLPVDFKTETRWALTATYNSQEGNMYISRIGRHRNQGMLDGGSYPFVLFLG